MILHTFKGPVLYQMYQSIRILVAERWMDTIQCDALRIVILYSCQGPAILQVVSRRILQVATLTRCRPSSRCQESGCQVSQSVKILAAASLLPSTAVKLSQQGDTCPEQVRHVPLAPAILTAPCTSTSTLHQQYLVLLELAIYLVPLALASSGLSNTECSAVNLQVSLSWCNIYCKSQVQKSAAVLK